jgi:predicted RNA binding protein YcfA (HicA-like mRNA interferase family)
LVKGFYEDVVRELSRLGFVCVRGGKGSHEKWRLEAVNQTETVPYRLMSRHLANTILRNAGSKLRL